MPDDLRHRSHSPEIAGRCPTCKRASLFVGVGGHITCSRLDCPSPAAADDVLHEDGYGDTARDAVIAGLRDQLARQAETLRSYQASVARVRDLHRVHHCEDGHMRDTTPAVCFNNRMCSCGRRSPCPDLAALDDAEEDETRG